MREGGREGGHQAALYVLLLDEALAVHVHHEDHGAQQRPLLVDAHLPNMSHDFESK